MIKDMNKTIDKIDELMSEFKAIQNGAMVNPRTGKILRDQNDKIIYYNNQKDEK